MHDEHIFSAFPKRTTDLPPLEPESDSESENNDPNKANTEVSSQHVVQKVQNESERIKETPKIDRRHSEETREEDEKLDKFSEMPWNLMFGPKSVLKRTFSTPSTGLKLKPAMLKSQSKSEGVLILAGTTARKKSPTRLQVVRSFAPPKNLLSARQLFTSDGREILGDSKKPMMTIKTTPSIFRGLLKTKVDDTLEDTSISQNNDSGHHSSRNDTLEDTVLNDEPHYSRIFDVSVAVERSLPDVDIEQFSKVLEERRPQLVERVAQLRGGMLQEMCKLEKGIEKLALTPKYNYKNRLKPHPMSPFKEPKTPPFAIPNAPPPPKSVKKIAADFDDEKCNVKTVITIEGKKYMLCRNLGKGGSGYVFEACAANQIDGTAYAIKVIFYLSFMDFCRIFLTFQRFFNLRWSICIEAQPYEKNICRKQKFLSFSKITSISFNISPPKFPKKTIMTSAIS